MAKFICLLFLFFSPLINFAQEVNWRRVPPNINRSSTNNFNPILSGDGTILMYLSDLAQGEGIKLWYTRRIKNGWSKQEVIDQHVDNFKVNTEGGYFLDFYGSEIVFTSKRYGSMGGYDIWNSIRSGNNWNQANNVGKPVNSNQHEGDPSLSIDGRFLYFSRCESMTQNSADNCVILMAKRKPNGYYEVPEELPNPINTGNETAPRLLADGKTMVFASKREGGKGGWDLYLSRFENQQWSTPINMWFLNTELDDRYVSVPARGEFIYFTREVNGYKNLVFAKIPPDYHQKLIFWLNGKVEDTHGSPVDYFVETINWPDRDVKRVLPKEDGTFTVLFTEGYDYDMAVMDKEGNYTFNSMFLDLAIMNKSERKGFRFVLDPIENGSTLFLNNLYFNEHTAELSYYAEFELERLKYLVKKHHGFNAEITTYLQNYKEDSIQSNPDLTELFIDTTRTTEIIENIDTVFSEITLDSIGINTNVDSMAQQVLNDSISISLSDSAVREMAFTVSITYDTLIHEVIDTTYHNNRTLLQSQAIKDFLIRNGAPDENITIFGNIVPSEAIKKRLIKLKRDYLVEVKFVQN